MQINQVQVNASTPMETHPTQPAAMPIKADTEMFESQLFDQLVSQSMTDMQKRQAEIKEILEKANEDQE